MECGLTHITSFPIGTSFSEARKRLESKIKNEERGKGNEIIDTYHVGNTTWWLIRQAGKQDCGIVETTLAYEAKHGTFMKHAHRAEGHQPRAHSCPLRFLKQAPEKSAPWRQKVFDYWQARSSSAAAKTLLKATLAPGDTVHLKQFHRLLGAGPAMFVEFNESGAKPLRVQSSSNGVIANIGYRDVHCAVFQPKQGAFEAAGVSDELQAAFEAWVRDLRAENAA